MKQEFSRILGTRGNSNAQHTCIQESQSLNEVGSWAVRYREVKVKWAFDDQLSYNGRHAISCWVRMVVEYERAQGNLTTYQDHYCRSIKSQTLNHNMIWYTLWTSHAVGLTSHITLWIFLDIILYSAVWRFHHQYKAFWMHNCGWVTWVVLQTCFLKRNKDFS